MRNTIHVVSVLEKLLDQLVNQLLENIAHPTSINQKNPSNSIGEITKKAGIKGGFVVLK